MKTARLLILAGASAPLILSNVASGDFIGLKTVKKDFTGFEDLVFMTVNVYAMFSDDDGDGIGDGSVLTMGGTPFQPGNVNVRDGVFYQHRFGGQRRHRRSSSWTSSRAWPSTRS